MSYLYRLFRATEEENRRVLMDLVLPQPEAEILDLGCYDGELTRRLGEKAGSTRLSGVEVLPDAAEKARARGIRVVEGNLNEPINLPSASFDVIHANQVIEHLVETDGFVCEIRRLLKPTGYALLSTNNLASLHNIVSLMLGRQPPPAHVSNRVLVGNAVNPLEGTEHSCAAMSHLRIFSYSALRSFLLHHGLKAEVYRTVGFYPLPIAMARVATWVAPVYGAFLTCRVRPV